MGAAPPFRAEHIGSLLRPAGLLQARAEAEGDQYRQATGPLDFAQLKDLEDAAIADAVRLQERVGLDVVTDGEFRRRSWFQDFLLALSGTGITWVDASATISAALPFQNDTTVEKLPGHIVRVHDKLKRVKGIFTGHFAFRTDDIDAVRKHLTDNGIPFSDWGEWAVKNWDQIFFNDPAGNIIEVHQVRE